MSSAAYLKFRPPLSLVEWEDFCRGHHIDYSPSTIGRNVFYRGEVQITFGEADYSDQAEPPKEAKEMVISTFYRGDLSAAALMVLEVKAQWPNVRCSYDPEIGRLVARQPRG